MHRHRRELGRDLSGQGAGHLKEELDRAGGLVSDMMRRGKQAPEPGVRPFEEVAPSLLAAAWSGRSLGFASTRSSGPTP